MTYLDASLRRITGEVDEWDDEDGHVHHVRCDCWVGAKGPMLGWRCEAMRARLDHLDDRIDAMEATR